MDVYAEKGFRNARVREICARAEVNVAAVNYYFGDKESLYNEVLRHAFFGVTGSDPMKQLSAAGPSAELRLRAFVEILLTQLFSEGRGALYARLVARELADPTAALERTINDGIRPQVDFLLAVVRDLLGPGASDQEVNRWAGSVLGQCLYYQFARPVIRQLHLESRSDVSVVPELAEHITRFSLAGLRR